MLFDLRSRGRRRTVQAVYLGLAVLIGGGLVLFGVGTGSGGGLLNGLGGNGSNQQNQVISQQEKAALRQTRQNPSSPSAWAALVSARWAQASSVGFDSSTNTYNAEGKKELAGVGAAWQRYSQLTQKPDPTIATLAARAYGALGQYSQQAAAWDAETAANPDQPNGFVCLAEAAYAANQTRKGDLATAKALSLAPKSTRKAIQTQINAVKSQPSLAANC